VKLSKENTEKKDSKENFVRQLDKQPLSNETSHRIPAPAEREETVLYYNLYNRWIITRVPLGDDFLLLPASSEI